MVSEEEIFFNKKPDKTYVSRQIKNKDAKGESINIRILSKVVDSEKGYTHAKIKDELVIRETGGRRQEVIAKIFEDDRNINVLTFQRFTSNTGSPHQVSFSFIGEEIEKVIGFFQSIPHIPFGEGRSSIKDNQLLNLVSPIQKPEQNISEEYEELIKEVLKNQVTKEDIVSVAYRKKQLETFEKLLFEEDFFRKAKKQLKLQKDEDVWQKFFEKNTWIFGYGLSYVFNSPLEGRKLEQVVCGYDFNNAGKRPDALLKTKGNVDSLCFVEIKTHLSKLLKESPIRPECWQVSDKMTEGVAQVQKTVQKSIKNIATKTEMKDKDGNLTGEKLFLYSPKSYLIIGNLSEFINGQGINEDKYSSFELFRQSLNKIEIITFDELFERAKFIIRNTEEVITT